MESTRIGHRLLHRSWFAPRKRREVDTPGIAVALAFIAVIGLLAGGRGDKPVDQPSRHLTESLSTAVEPTEAVSFRQDRSSAHQG